MAMRISAKQVLGVAVVSLAGLLGACAGRPGGPSAGEPGRRHRQILP